MKMARVVGGIVVDMMDTPKGHADRWVQDTTNEAEIGCQWSEEQGFYNFPDASLRLVVKALVLIIKANMDKITIPPAAVAIWQRVKEDKL